MPYIHINTDSAARVSPPCKGGVRGGGPGAIGRQVRGPRVDRILRTQASKLTLEGLRTSSLVDANAPFGNGAAGALSTPPDPPFARGGKDALSTVKGATITGLDSLH